MEVKPGFKLTEVGVIPEEWEPKPLHSVLSKGRLGGNYPNQDTQTELPLMKMGNIARGYFDISKVEYITPGVSPESDHRLAYGDVLFNTRNTLELVGKVAIWRDEIPVAYYNSNLMRLEFDAKEVCSNEYASYALNTAGSVARLRALATGTTSVAAIYTRDLMGLQFVVPPKREQRAIAGALSDVDALIGALGQLIAKKRDLKQAAMRQLLTGETSLPGFRGEWDVKRLADLAEIVSGGTPRTTEPAYWNGGIKWCTPTDITGCAGKHLNETERTISQLGLQNSGASLLPAGALLLCSRATIGEVKIAAGEICTNQGFKSLVCLPGMSNEFLYYKLLTMKQQMRRRAFGSTFLEISKANLAALEINTPPPLEQTAIAAVLSDMDAELAALEARRHKTRALKQAMMQELLTGRTRLV